ncbi:hypothetical protein Pmani_030598 [Petrolisthes manimaculis]|uniref:ATP synthase-coupling factor 6, mitochondrial n=1 Tax=Petrolisthes manimaculis TaxID=1843537 RepID=A0AAE1NX05_9EUCA|nr:hypothetical protein Pmani_030598 [Petrolisthes manimaculis]
MPESPIQFPRLRNIPHTWQRCDDVNKPSWEVTVITPNHNIVFCDVISSATCMHLLSANTGGRPLYLYISKMIVTRILPEARTLQAALRRNYGVSAILMKKAVDPIQQLFVDKIQEYSKKSKTAGGKLVDATPEIERQLQQELDKVARQYGGGAGVDMTKFPDFKFSDPKVEAS